MKNGFTDEDRKKIEDGIRQRYAKAAQSPKGHFRYPTGKAGLEALGYDRSILRILPDEVLASYCGVGQPFILDQINPGESVLDVGCGAGVDTIIAGIMVGPQGKTVGIDLVPEMVQRAKQNLQITQLHNVSFELGSGENLPFASEGFDCVISNGAYNLIPDKAKALQEAFRVLKHAGRFMIADQVLSGGLPSNPMEMVKTWAK
ncbi:Methyltransferase type 11 [Syntrophobacter sp. SbD2]|nr:Methyltransferase type 11 [Syntrophobacter sp. SbD2]